jgi:hypothetical protein
MACFRISGQDLSLPWSVLDLVFLKTGDNQQDDPLSSTSSLTLSRRTVGWVGGKNRKVETWRASPGYLLKVTGGSDFYIAPDGGSIVKAEHGAGKQPSGLSALDRHILLGPALVLALALHETWCLHASAALYKGDLIVLLGESGRGKSTLAGYLSEDFPDWRLVADDILPVSMTAEGVTAWPRFPQLKLPGDGQPGADLPEKIRVSKVCVLTSSRSGGKSDPQLLPAAQAIQEYLGHTAGARLFEPDLLEKHLAFCAQAAGSVPVYRLPYTRRHSALPHVKEQLESLC